MGTVIKSASINNSTDDNRQLSLISDAAKSCLNRVNLSIDEVGMLINTGLYSENHLTEPAKAALIQNSLNGKYTSLEEEWSAHCNLFSFDLHCGGGGIIQAFQVLDGFIRTGDFENGLIVSGDVHPQIGNHNTLSFRNGAAAVLVSKSSDESGFVQFKTETHSKYLNDFESKTNWSTGKFDFTTKQNTNYLEHCISCTLKTIKSFFEENELFWHDFDLVVASQSPGGFANLLQKHLETDIKVFPTNETSANHSSGLLFSIDKFFNEPQFQTVRNILFVAVGAGITVSLAYYKNIV